MALLKTGHRLRGIQHDLADIPMLQQGILLAQQFGVDWYVNSAAAAGGDGRTPDSAFQTIAAAQAQASANDRVYLAPGHAETISAAGGITLSKAGVSYIGLGSGTNRPTLTFSVVGATFIISAANVLLSNVRVTTSVDEMVSMFTISGQGVILDRVDLFETVSAQTIQFAVVTGKDCSIQNCQHHQVTAATAAQRWIALTGADRFKLLNNLFVLTLSDQATSCTCGVVTTQCIGVLFAGNQIYQLGFSAAQVSAFISLVGTTGIVANNNILAPVTANTTINDMPGCASFNTLCTNALDKSGILDPIADT